MTECWSILRCQAIVKQKKFRASQWHNLWGCTYGCNGITIIKVFWIVEQNRSNIVICTQSDKDFGNLTELNKNSTMPSINFLISINPSNQLNLMNWSQSSFAAKLFFKTKHNEMIFRSPTQSETFISILSRKLLTKSNKNEFLFFFLLTFHSREKNPGNVHKFTHRVMAQIILPESDKPQGRS